MSDKGVGLGTAFRGTAIPWIQNNRGYVIFGLGCACLLGLSFFAWYQWRGYVERRAYEKIYPYQADFETAYQKANGENHRRGVVSLSDIFTRRESPPFVYSEEMKKKSEDYEKALKSLGNIAASAVSAVDLADFYHKAGERKKAMALLSFFLQRNLSSSVQALIRFQLAGLYMDEKNCEKALPLLLQIIKDKKARPFHPESRLRYGLCQEQMNASALAEEAYTEIMKEYPGSVTAGTAEIYLRLFKIEGRSGK